MTGHIPLMALYGVLALAVAVTAKITESNFRNRELFQRRPWLMLVLHVPVLLAWLHVCLYLVYELVVAKMPGNRMEYVHLCIHSLVLLCVGLACMFTYALQLYEWRSQSTELKRG